MNLRYFKIPPKQYEIVRKTLDDTLGFPNEHTITSITPEADTIKDVLDKHCLFATASKEFAEAFANSPNAVEITQEMYEFMIQESHN